MNEVQPSFPLSRNGQTAEELEANSKYIKNQYERIRKQRGSLLKAVAIHKIMRQPYYGKPKQT